MPVSSMSNHWASPHRGQSIACQEYETVAELWLANKNSSFGSTRKLQVAQQRRRNNDKRESVVQLTTLTEASPRKIKEKSSWISMGRGYATTASAAGQWVRVRCSLVENTTTCTLTIIGDKGTLQHSLHVNLLRATDIRFADRSLFWRNDCLGIHARHTAFAAHSPSLQSLVSTSSPDYSGHVQTHRRQPSSGPILQPIYLAFESKDAVNCWNALLRSYAQPEIYGDNVVPGGLYRMWRQVDLRVQSGRNLGALGKPPSDSLTPTSLLEAERGDGLTESIADSEVFCEIVLDSLVSGRTTMKKGQGADPPNWTWFEGFLFPDLPPFGGLSVRVWREKRASKPVLVGSVDIVLANFRRGQFVEGWYPVLYTVTGGNGIQVGDLKLKIKVDEEIILPSEAYSAITSTLDYRNCLDILSELDQKMQLGDISQHMLSLAVGRGTFLQDVFDLAEREVDNAPNANTLFRGNSVFTKTMEQAMSFFGKSFLEASVGPTIQELCLERVEIETDPSRNSSRPKEVEASVKLLPIWCAKFWHQIYKVRADCPSELRRLFQCIRELVERRFGPHTAELKWQSVSAFCFLRLIVPAILHPHLFGLHPGLPPPGLQRSLTLVAKAMQSLANLSREQKESHMQSVEVFLEENIPVMIEYIAQISSPLPDRSPPDVDAIDGYDRLRIMHSLRDRARVLPPLTHESIPVLPHLLDVPKHLAILSSAVIRHARMTPHSVASRPAPLAQDSLVEDFAIKCFEIEAKAVQAVSRLASPSATTASRHSRRVPSRRSNSPSRDGRETERTRPIPFSPTVDSPVPRTPDTPRRQRRKSSRPSTAPAASNNASPFHTPLPSPPLMPSPPLSKSTGSARPSTDTGGTTPASPTVRFFKRPPTSPTEQHPVFHLPHADSSGLRRTLSHQLTDHDVVEEAAAKPRGGFLRSWLSRPGR